jgi:hypothetical protein
MNNKSTKWKAVGIGQSIDGQLCLKSLRWDRAMFLTNFMNFPDFSELFTCLCCNLDNFNYLAEVSVAVQATSRNGNFFASGQFLFGPTQTSWWVFRGPGKVCCQGI